MLRTSFGNARERCFGFSVFNWLPLILLLLVWLVASCWFCHPACGQQITGAWIQPSKQYPTYWQYQGKPVLLAGGSATDHIFLLDGLKDHLDEMRNVGANFVRCTMSQREGRELKPHRLKPDGKYDLQQWNPEYWNRFSQMLQWTAERKIFLQIEVWDRFDFSTEHWDISPWNPVNNVNYSAAETGLATRYPLHPSRDRQPFFHTIPGMPRYDRKLDRVRLHQERFVDKMLSYSLKYDHVLYCMDNETSTPASWGQYWIERIQKAAANQKKQVWTTDMFDDAFLGARATHTPILFSDADHYRFVDISQVNSRNYDQDHWNQLIWLIDQVNKNRPRPVNHTKIYGSGYKSFGTGGPEDGVERFWRNLIAGSAAVRFHRPDSGNGLNDYAKGAIRAVRLVEKRVRFWEIKPRMDLLADREPNEAYLAADPGRAYVLYFPDGGKVTLDLKKARGNFNLAWVSVSMGIEVNTTQGGGWRTSPRTVSGGKPVTLAAPYKGGWVAVLTGQTKNQPSPK